MGITWSIVLAAGLGSRFGGNKQLAIRLIARLLASQAYCFACQQDGLVYAFFVQVATTWLTIRIELCILTIAPPLVPDR